MIDMNDYCDREELVAAYLDRTLPEEERLEFEEHLATCDSCLVELISAKSELREITAETADGPTDRHGESVHARSGFTRPSRHVIPPVQSKGSPAIQAALSCCAAIAFAFIFVAMIHSYRFDAGYREGAYMLDRLLEVRETGALLLSGSASRPRGETYTVRGNRSLHVGLSLETADRLRSTLARHPESANVLIALGHYHMADRRPDMARMYYERALDLRPGDARVLNDLAAAFYRQGSSSGAEKLLLRAKEGKNAPPEVFYNLGVLYGETGDRELQRLFIHLFLESASGSPRAAEARRMLED